MVEPRLRVRRMICPRPASLRRRGAWRAGYRHRPSLPAHHRRRAAWRVHCPWSPLLAPGRLSCSHVRSHVRSQVRSHVRSHVRSRRPPGDVRRRRRTSARSRPPRTPRSQPLLASDYPLASRPLRASDPRAGRAPPHRRAPPPRRAPPHRRPPPSRQPPPHRRPPPIRHHERFRPPPATHPRSGRRFAHRRGAGGGPRAPHSSRPSPHPPGELPEGAPVQSRPAPDRAHDRRDVLLGLGVWRDPAVLLDCTRTRVVRGKSERDRAPFVEVAREQ